MTLIFILVICSFAAYFIAAQQAVVGILLGIIALLLVRRLMSKYLLDLPTDIYL